MKNKLENSYKIKIGGSKMLDIKRIRENLEDIKKAMDRSCLLYTSDKNHLKGIFYVQGN